MEGMKHGHALILGFGAVIVGKILAAAIAKYLGFAM
jgi:hypothetical protein